jgi:small subunit ribosomal protein S16
LAVRIRLKRMGAKKRPFYRIVVADSRSPRDGRFIEEIGIYNPTTEPSTLVVNEEKAADWLKKGAKPSETVKSLLKKAGIVG